MGRRIRMLICLLTSLSGGAGVCGLQQLGTEGSSKGLDSGRDAVLRDQTGWPAPPQGCALGEWAPSENLPGWPGPGDAGATEGGTRQKARPPHTVHSQPQPHAGPALPQGFGCGQTDSCPHVAGLLLRGEDKNQVKTKQTDEAAPLGR